MKVRTDLAIECREMFAEEIAGVESSTRSDEKIKVTHVKVTNSDAAEKLGKPMGNYITVEIGDMNREDDEIFERGADAVAEELKKILKIPKNSPVLVVGLGNRYITPDSIGPKTVKKLLVTRHITSQFAGEYSFSLRPVSAVAPGVSALTGIETSEIISGIVNLIKPSLIIAVDALASRSLKRLGTTVQIADTGITPGSGVGNHRHALTKDSMGIPVIAVGVPMVTDAATMAIDAAKSALSLGEKDALFKNALSHSDSLKDFLFENSTNMIVTPNDADVISDQASGIIAEGINRALHIAKMG